MPVTGPLTVEQVRSMRDRGLTRVALNPDDAERLAEDWLRLHAENERLKQHYEPFVVIVAALAIYGEKASLPALVEKARALNEAEAARAVLGEGEK